MSDQIIKNMLVKLEDLFACYHDKCELSGHKISVEVTQALIDFIHYRSNFAEIVNKLLFMGIVDHETAWMMDCYGDYMTHCAQIFDNDRSFNPELKKQVIEWRRKFDDD
ncbi:MAG: hypothetical protein EHM34_06395 [Nitrosopumilales archaeon]|nr:MAG: hypothetical protein EHM34_06395 [Nitrosopumilales archaeon]